MQESKWFNKLPGFQRSPSGLEWIILKKIPKIFAVGTLIPLAFLGWSYFERNNLNTDTAANDKTFQNIEFIIYGVISLHWSFVLFLTILCSIVAIMKGPAYVADAYHLNDKDKL